MKEQFKHYQKMPLTQNFQNVNVRMICSTQPLFSVNCYKQYFSFAMFKRRKSFFFSMINNILSTSCACPTTNNVFVLFSLQMNMKSMWLDTVEGVTTTIRQSFRCQGALLRLPPPQPRMPQREQWFSTHGDNSPWLTRLAKKSMSCSTKYTR